MHTDDVTDLIREVAARVILPRFRTLGVGDVEHKRPGDLVTVADREAEAELTDALRAAEPGVLVVGEEAAFDDADLVGLLPGAARAWVIDPVDGTRNFAHGSPDFGVMLAEVEHGRAVRSWIWQPIHERLYVAERGGGVRYNGTPLAPVSRRRPPYRVAAYGALRRQPAAGLDVGHTYGSCAIDYPRLLAGGVDALAYRSLHPWDHLPGTLMLTELGGHAAVDGIPYAAGVTGSVLFAAASAAILDDVVGRLAP